MNVKCYWKFINVTLFLLISTIVWASTAFTSITAGFYCLYCHGCHGYHDCLYNPYSPYVPCNLYDPIVPVTFVMHGPCNYGLLFHYCCASSTTVLPLFVQFRNRLRKIHLYPPIINQHIIHFEVSLFTSSLLLEFDERVAQWSASVPVSDDFAGRDRSETGKIILGRLIGWSDSIYRRKNVFGGFTSAEGKSPIISRTRALLLAARSLSSASISSSLFPRKSSKGFVSPDSFIL